MLEQSNLQPKLRIFSPVILFHENQTNNHNLVQLQRQKSTRHVKDKHFHSGEQIIQS
ncbi:hypothetical protein BD560DRAFT_408122, partial [Blakeslea trispora]